MDGKNFDRFAQRLASASSRRSFLKGVVGSALAAGLGSLRPGQANAASCRSTGDVCREHANCCSGVCGPKDRLGRQVCVCPTGTVDCKGQCANPTTAFQSDPANCGACGVKCPRTRCQIGICVNGTCGYAPDPKMVGLTCDDGNRCTTGDTCQSDGSCAGTLITCPTPTPCHAVGVCDPQTGQCSNPIAPNGTTCDDGNACTQTDTCRNGVCVGSNPIVCTALDQCHVMGTCDPATGICSNPDARDGTPCNDGNACTTGDTCQQGICTGGAATVCDSGIPCIVDSCDPAAGCIQRFKDAGTPCADTDRCDGDEVCNGQGVCVDGTPITCAPPVDSQCQDAGVCDVATGTCSYANKQDGTICTLTDQCFGSASCQNGVCTGGNPVVCQASGQCHVAGTCDPATGACSNPNAPDGTGCDDTNRCTTNTTCTAGVCGGGNALTCDDNNPCTVDSCDPRTGCVNTPKDCDDNNPCTTDRCDPQTGQCLHTPKTCSSQDECHVAGVCNPQTGQCSNPAAPSGTTCSDGNANCHDGFCCDGGRLCQVLVIEDGLPLRYEPTCCGSGTTCSTRTIEGGDVSECCPDDQSVQVSFVDNKMLVTCGTGNGTGCPTELCQVVDFDESGNQVPRPNTCCPTGTSCSTASIDVFAFSQCCPEGESTQFSIANGVPSIGCAPSAPDCGDDTCPIYGPGSEGICCPSGTGCSTLTLGNAVFSRCCPDGETAQISVETGSAEVVCAPGVATCPTDLCPVNGTVSGLPDGGGVCCPSGTACSTTTFGGITFGQCCPDGETAQLSFASGEFAVECAVPCQDDLCPVNGEVSGLPGVGGVCCPSGTSCSTTTFYGRTFGQCCPDGETAQMSSASGELSVACAAPCEEAICPVYGHLFGIAESDGVCCPSGTTCSTTSFGSLTFAQCCPEGQSIRLSQGSGDAMVECAPTCPTDLCPVSDGVGGISGLDGVCCPADTRCSTVSVAGITIGQCCPDGLVAQLDSTSNGLTAICSDSCRTEICPTFYGNSTNPFSGTCCPSDTTCSQVQVGGYSVGGLCCPPGQQAVMILEGVTPKLVCSANVIGSCPVGQLVGGVPSGITPTVCGPDTDCTTQIVGGTEVGLCCPHGQSAHLTTMNGEQILVCEEGCQIGQSICINPSSSSLAQGCCNGHCSAQTYSVLGLALPMGPEICCPVGTRPQKGLVGVSAYTCGVWHPDPCPVLTFGDTPPILIPALGISIPFIIQTLDQLCGDGTICSYVEIGDATAGGAQSIWGRCCPPNQSIAFQNGADQPVCCAENRLCPVDGFPVPGCCADGETCGANGCRA